MAEDIIDTIGNSAERVYDQAQDSLEQIQAQAQAKFEETQAKAQAILDSLPTPQDLLASIQPPALPTTEAVVDAIIPGAMSNTELIAFLSPTQISLPGLNVNTLLQLGFVTQFREELAKYDTPEERQAFVERYYEDYVTKNKEKIQRGIASIKSKYNAAKDRLEKLIKRIQSGIARIINPPVVGTAAPNPTRVAQDYIDLKQQAENELQSISQDLVQLILAAEEVGWDLPEPIDFLIQTVGTAKKTLELIPV